MYFKRLVSFQMHTNLVFNGLRLIETSTQSLLRESVKSVNKLLIKYSKQHHWSLVRHSNITEKVLNRGGLHLTKQGNELLYKNFASCLVAKEANNHWTVSSNADRLKFQLNLITILTIIAYQFNPQCWISRDPLLTTSFLQNVDLS